MTKCATFPPKYTTLAFNLKFIHMAEFLSTDIVRAKYQVFSVWTGVRRPDRANR